MSNTFSSLLLRPVVVFLSLLLSQPPHIYCLACFPFEDINECLLGSHHCRPGERCINTLGSYRCQREVSCGTGYELTDSNNCNGHLTNITSTSRWNCVKIYLRSYSSNAPKTTCICVFEPVFI